MTDDSAPVPAQEPCEKWPDCPPDCPGHRYAPGHEPRGPLYPPTPGTRDEPPQATAAPVPAQEPPTNLALCGDSG